MATRTRGRSKQWQPVRVRSEEDRGGGRSEFLRLDEGQRFLGYALFNGDPATDEPGYYEYLEHWDNNAKRSVPCAGEDCPLCEDGDKPKVRAQTLWLVTRDENGNDLKEPELRIFMANWNVIKILTEMRAEGDKIKGVQFRVTRNDDRGNYMLMPKSAKLSTTEVKEALKSDEAPNFDEMITNRLNKAMEGYSVRKALDDDDDDDEVEKPRRRNSTRAKADPEPEDDDDAPTDEDFPADGEGLDVYVFEVDEEKLVVGREGVEEQVEVWATGDVDISEIGPETWVSIDFETQEDYGDEFVALLAVSPSEEAEPEEEEEETEPEGGNDLPDEISGEVFEVSGEVNEENGSIPVSNEDYEFMLYVLEGVDIDWDDYTVGTKVKVNAEKDAVGDMLTSEAPELVKASRRGSTSGSRASSGGASKKKASSKKASSKKTSSRGTTKTSSKKTSSRAASKNKTATRKGR